MIRYVLFFISLSISASSNAQTITKDMLGGPTGYFKTYDDFLHNRYVPFNKPKFSKHGLPQAITFHAGKATETISTNDIWGYRYKHILFRIAPSAQYGIAIVVGVGDLILYESYHSPQLFISDDGQRASYQSYSLTTYISKDLNSKIFTDVADLKSESNVNADILTCNRDMVVCYLTYSSINYACTFGNYKQVNHQVKANTVKNKTPSGGH